MTSIEERYMRATVSSHLESKSHEEGDLDLIVAAAWSHEQLGASLLRLRTEYDAAAGEIKAERLTARALVLMRLRTLDETRQGLYAFAVSEATRQHFMVPDKALAPIVGRVLDFWLDPICHHCDGRGFIGGSHRGEVRVLCRPCRGTGLRRDWAGHKFEEQRFAGHLLGVIQERLHKALREMRERLKEVVAKPQESP